MNSSSQVTLRQIALQAGCSHVTVSFALRNDPRISSSTRLRIQKLAQRMGYQTNPLISTLMTQLRQKNKMPYVATLAWIYHHTPQETELRSSCEFIYPHVVQRATQLGYKVEPYWIHSPGMTVARLNRILHAQNIKGLIIAPWTKHKVFWPLQWDRLSVVTIGWGPHQPDFNRVVPDTFRNITLALKQLNLGGYRRIGLVLSDWIQDVAAEEVSGAFRLDYYQQASSEHIPWLMLSDFSFKSERQFASYIRDYKPDAIICFGSIYKSWLEKLGLSVPKDIGMAKVDVKSDPLTHDWAGIDIHHEHLAASAVDLLVSELQNNRIGLPPFSKAISIKGHWVSGSTVNKAIRGLEDSGPVIAIVITNNLSVERSGFFTSLISALEKEINRLGFVSTSDRRRWCSRIYDGLRTLPGKDPSWYHANARLYADLCYHDFRGWIGIGQGLSVPSISREIGHLPNARFSPTMDVQLDWEDFFFSSLSHLSNKGCKDVVYLVSQARYSTDQSMFSRIAKGLNFKRAEVIPFDYIGSHQMDPSQIGTYPRDLAIYEFILDLASEWKKSGSTPDALMVWDDIAMRPLARGLLRTGISIPKHLKIVTQACQEARITYTTPVYRYEWSVTPIAKELVKILKSRLSHESPGPLPRILKGSIAPGPCRV